MAGTKLALAKHAVDRALVGLDPKDRFAIVTYDDHIETVVDSRLATDANKRAARLALQAVDARGSTDLHGGWTARRRCHPRAPRSRWRQPGACS